MASFSDKEKTAFSVPGIGHYNLHFNVLPFGLVDVPATFQRLMDMVPRGLPWEICVLYLDDILSHHKKFDLALDGLREIFIWLRMSGLKLNAKKCHIFQKKVAFLGHIVSKEGVSTDPAKVDAVTEWPIPKNQREVRSFIGLASYYRRYVRNFTAIAKPLNILMEKGKTFTWDDKADSAFKSLKQKLTEAPALAYPMPGRPFILDTDASNNAIGGVLIQEQDAILCHTKGNVRNCGQC
jgi:hypothetical protein